MMNLVSDFGLKKHLEVALHLDKWFLTVEMMDIRANESPNQRIRTDLTFFLDESPVLS